VVLRGFEKRLEGMVEGVFARAFRSGLRPVEIGRRLVREMDDGRSVGVSGRTVVPNDFDVQLSDPDFERFAEVDDVLVRELCDAARDHARSEDYSFMGPVRVRLVLDDTRRTGTFRIIPHFREADGGVGAGSLLLPSGKRLVLTESIATIGRLPECTVTVADPNVSRTHAEIRPDGDGFIVVDLGSTNGTRVNGGRIDRHRLADGDELSFGNTVVRFEAS